MNAEVLAFVLYFVLMLAIGLYFFLASKKNSSEKEYFLGGRAMGPWVTAMSAQASDMSAWLLMGLPGSILAFGLGQAWIGIGLAIGTSLNWIIVAKRLRKFSKASGDSITLPQYLSNRFVSKNHTLSILCAVVFLISFTIYVASSFVAGATVFTTLFPSLQEGTAMLIFAAIILIYTFLGGYKAVCWTDFFQGMLMLIALLAMPIVILAAVGKELRRLYTARMALDAGKDRFWLKQLWNMRSDYPAKLLMQAAKKVDHDWCSSAVIRCQKLDRRMKSERGMDSEAELKLFLMELAGAR